MLGYKDDLTHTLICHIHSIVENENSVYSAIVKFPKMSSKPEGDILIFLKAENVTLTFSDRY